MIRYEIIIYWSEEDEAFIVEVPELPGCMADGATYQEAIANAVVVIQEWIETARELESSHYMELCDSVSATPSDLILSVLATSGYADMHPELAREKWSIDETIDAEMDAESTLIKTLGHQAFFVIDKRSVFAF